MNVACAWRALRRVHRAVRLCESWIRSLCFLRRPRPLCGRPFLPLTFAVHHNRSGDNVDLPEDRQPACIVPMLFEQLGHRVSQIKATDGEQSDASGAQGKETTGKSQDGADEEASGGQAEA